jgi:hypothetical protein
MAHWAELDSDNKVLRVVVGDNNDPNNDEGYSWLIENLGGTWVQTSYNHNFRKQYAGIGYTYDSQADVFITPQPFSSWILDEDYNWQAPIPKPEGNYRWDEETLSWLEVEEV